MPEPANPALLRFIQSARTYRTRDGYVLVRTGAMPRVMHRLVWEAWNGPIPSGHVVHHINHVKDDNRIENLRAMPSGQHTSEHMRKYHKMYDRCPSYQDLRADGICVSCKRTRAASGLVLCFPCSVKSRNSTSVSAVRNKWRDRHPLRCCPRCGADAKCKVSQMVCDPCIERHLRSCRFLSGPTPYYGRGAAICVIDEKTIHPDRSLVIRWADAGKRNAPSI